jgi:hypothetical protein
MVLCCYFCVLIASANGPTAALNEHNVRHGVQNGAAGPMKTKCLTFWYRSFTFNSNKSPT